MAEPNQDGNINRRLRLLAGLAGVAVLAAALAYLAVSQLGFFAAAENRINDIRTASLSPAEPQHEKIVIISITEETLAQAKLPYRSPIDRDFLTDLLEVLARKGVAAIGVDILLDQPTEPDKDARLQAFLARPPVPLVAAFTSLADYPTDTGAIGEKLAQEKIAYLKTMLKPGNRALVNLLTDPHDNTARWIYPGANVDGAWIPGIASALAVRVGGAPLQEMRRLRYRQPPDAKTPTFRTFPAHAVSFLPAPLLAGRIALIGADLEGTDRHRTPFNAIPGQDIEMPGVQIHAHGLAQLLDGTPAPGMSQFQTIALVLAAALMGAGLALPSIAAFFKISAGIVILFAFWLGGFWFYARTGVLVPLLSPSLAALAGYGGGTLLMYTHERKMKRFVQTAFSRYVAPAMVRELVNDPGMLKLGGEQREITSLFTDLQGFTTLVEQHDPSVVLPALNTYLDGMCAIAFKHGGTLDKLIGDALCLFFGAPLDQPDHAQRAVACALEMDAFATQFVIRQKAAGLPFGKTRIGVNTGRAVVGNFGGEAFFDYTAQGDTINTAARLEGANKYFGTNLCVSITTAEQCNGTLFRPICAVVVMGKATGIQVFEPVAPGSDKALGLKAYRNAYTLLERGDSRAAAAFDDILQQHPEDPLARFHAARLRDGASGTSVKMEGK
ncbi:MAG: CHASE2 domain-containing protein [Magnetospiraceae bacterium]